MKEINWARISAGLLLWQGVVVVAASVMVVGVIGVMGKSLPSQIPLFYSQPWGEEQLTSPWGMTWAVGAIWAAWALSWLTARSGTEKILTAFVAGAGLVSEIIIVLGLIRIVMIIT